MIQASHVHTATFGLAGASLASIVMQHSCHAHQRLSGQWVHNWSAVTLLQAQDLHLFPGGYAGSQVLLFWVQCVHKGALVCRRNAEDDLLTPPRCLIAVKVPAQTKVDGEMEPCTVIRGFR
jgi:hypothetical protein